MKHRLIKSSLRTLTVGCVLIFLPSGTPALAQDPALPPQTQDNPQGPKLSSDQLDNLVAPIALYPDPLLSQLLVASTYPLEIVEAQQWLQQNKNLQGDQLMDAARQQNWDPSVQALVAFPDVLTRLNQDIRWTTDLGNAFLAQQEDVMSSVQHMRERAKDAGKLSSTSQQTVKTETQGDKTVIKIQPANPQVIYVPAYDPAYIWGPPLWGYYPSLYYSGFGFGFGPAVNVGFYFGGWGGWGGWGWGPNWFGRTVVVNNYFFNHYGFRPGPWGARPGIWAHNPIHRMGVPYPNRQLANGFHAMPRIAPHPIARPSMPARVAAPPAMRSPPQFHAAPRMAAPTPHGNFGFHGGGFHGGGGHRGR